MFALEVGCLGYCPHSFLHCFEALGLPKSAARQIRSEASKTALRSSYVLFLRRGMPTWECQAVLCWIMLTSRSFRFFVFICFAISVSHRSRPETTRSVSKHTHNTSSLFEFFNCQTKAVPSSYSIAYSSFSRASLRIKFPSSQLVALSLFFVTWTQRCVCGSSIGGSLFLICSWLLWLSNNLNQKEKKKRKMQSSLVKPACVWSGIFSLKRTKDGPRLFWNLYRSWANLALFCAVKAASNI